MDRINGVKAGTGISARWGNDIVDQIRRLHLIPGNGIKISTTSKGTRIELDLPQEQSSSSGVAISDVIPCKITESGDGAQLSGYSVALYANGFWDASTDTGKLFIPELATQTSLPIDTSILAHVCEATYTQSSQENYQGGNS